MRFTAAGVQLNLGEIGKGIALDLMKQMLGERGVCCAFLSFGESSISVIGNMQPEFPEFPESAIDVSADARLRRRFLQQLTRMLAGTARLSQLPWFSSLRAAPAGNAASDKARLGLIGVGSRGLYLLEHLLRTLVSKSLPCATTMHLIPRTAKSYSANPTLHTNEGRTHLSPGMGARFKAGTVTRTA